MLSTVAWECCSAPGWLQIQLQQARCHGACCGALFIFDVVGLFGVNYGCRVCRQAGMTCDQPFSLRG